MLISFVDGKIKVTVEHDLMFNWFVMTGVLLALSIKPLGY